MNNPDLDYRTLFSGGSGSTAHNKSLTNTAAPTAQCETILLSLLDTRHLSDRFSLTSAEKNVVENFVLGKSYSDIAELRKVRRDTIKTQISSILAKTGCTSRAKLILLVLCINNQPEPTFLQ